MMKELGVGDDQNRIFLTSENNIIRIVPNIRDQRWINLNKIIFKIFKQEIINYIYNFITKRQEITNNKQNIPLYLPMLSVEKYNIYSVEKLESITRPHEWTRNQIKEALLSICEIQKFVGELCEGGLLGRSYNPIIVKLRSSTELFIDSFLNKNVLSYHRASVEELDKLLNEFNENDFLSKFFNFTESEILELNKRGLKKELTKIFDDKLYTDKTQINLTDCGLHNISFKFNRPTFIDIGSFTNSIQHKIDLIDSRMKWLEIINIADFDHLREYLYNCAEFNNEIFTGLLKSVKFNSDAVESKLEKRYYHMKWLVSRLQDCGWGSNFADFTNHNNENIKQWDNYYDEMKNRCWGKRIRNVIQQNRRTRFGSRENNRYRWK